MPGCMCPKVEDMGPFSALRIDTSGGGVKFGALFH